MNTLFAAVHESGNGTDRRSAAPREHRQLFEGHLKRRDGLPGWSRRPNLTPADHRGLAPRWWIATMPRNALAKNQAIFYSTGHLAYVLRMTSTVVADAFHLPLPGLGACMWWP